MRVGAEAFFSCESLLLLEMLKASVLVSLLNSIYSWSFSDAQVMCKSARLVILGRDMSVFDSMLSGASESCRLQGGV